MLEISIDKLRTMVWCYARWGIIKEDKKYFSSQTAYLIHLMLSLHSIKAGWISTITCNCMHEACSVFGYSNVSLIWTKLIISQNLLQLKFIFLRLQARWQKKRTSLITIHYTNWHFYLKHFISYSKEFFPFFNSNFAFTFDSV